MQPLQPVDGLGFVVTTEFDHEQGRRPALHGAHGMLECQVFAGQIDQHLVHQLDGRRLKLQTSSERIHRRGQRDEVNHEQQANLWPRHQTDRRLGDDGQRALTADDQLMKARGVGGTQHIEVVAAHAPKNPREPLANLAGLLLDGAADTPINHSFERAAGGALVPLGGTERAELRGAAVGEHNAEPPDVIDGLAVDDGAGAG